MTYWIPVDDKKNHNEDGDQDDQDDKESVRDGVADGSLNDLRVVNGGHYKLNGLNNRQRCFF